jgi:hypothetical protein
MDGKTQFEHGDATDELDGTLHLQAFYTRSGSSSQTHTAATRHSPQNSSGPRLIETRAMPTAP